MWLQLVRPFRLLRRYGRRSVFWRNWLIVLVSILGPILILAMVLFSMIYGAYRSDIDTRCLRQAERYAQAVDTAALRARELLDTLCNSEVVSKLSQAVEIDTLWYPHLNWTLQTKALLYSSMRSSGDVDLLLVYFQAPDKVIDSEGYSLMRADHRERPFIDAYARQPGLGQALWPDGLRVMLSQPLRIGYSQPIWLMGTIGHVRLTEMFQSHVDMEQVAQAWLVLDGQGIGLTGEGLAMVEALSTELPQDSGRIASGQMQCFFARVGDTGMIIQTQYQSRRLYAELNWYGAILCLGVALSCMAALYSSLLIAERVTAPIHLLMQRIAPDTEGRPLDDKFDELEEIKSISDSYQGSLDENRLLRMTLEERRLLLRQAQLTALEYQVHPHMIHNALESINWAVRRQIGLDNPISTAIVELGDLMRFGLEDAGQLIPLTQEIEQLHNFIRLQHFQHPNRLEVIWAVNEKLLPLAVIKLSLQPLVENALKHAFAQADKPTLWIEGELEADIVTLRIRDNGAGITPETLARIRAELKAPSMSGLRHLGLMNVHLRYRLLFGESFGLRVDSRQGAYTEITLRYPQVED